MTAGAKLAQEVGRAGEAWRTTALACPSPCWRLSGHMNNESWRKRSAIARPDKAVALAKPGGRPWRGTGLSKGHMTLACPLAQEKQLQHGQKRWRWRGTGLSICPRKAAGPVHSSKRNWCGGRPWALSHPHCHTGQWLGLADDPGKAHDGRRSWEAKNERRPAKPWRGTVHSPKRSCRNMTAADPGGTKLAQEQLRRRTTLGLAKPDEPGGAVPREVGAIRTAGDPGEAQAPQKLAQEVGRRPWRGRQGRALPRWGRALRDKGTLFYYWSIERDRSQAWLARSAGCSSRSGSVRWHWLPSGEALLV